MGVWVSDTTQSRAVRRADPAIFDAWVQDDLEAWLRVPELEVWPGDYTGPVLFVYGDPDAGSMANSEARQYNQERYPWAEVVDVLGTDHMLGLEDDFGPVAAAIRRFLATFRA